jgi:mucin-19
VPRLNSWVAVDDRVGAAQGNYTLTVTPPVLSAANSSSAGFLNVANYTFTPSTVVTTNAGYSTNYATSFPVLSVPGTISITPLALSINTPAPSKVYDASNVIAGVGLVAGNAKSGDQISLSGSGLFSSANAGTNLSYTINSVAISGADAANYSFSGTVFGSNGVITQAALTVSGISASNKVYDTTQVVTFTGTPSLIGVMLGDAVDVAGSPAATFAQANVANNIPVVFDNSSLTLSNPNYFIGGLTQSQTASITPALITVTASKVYDGNTTVASSNLAIAGIAGQTLGASSGSAILTNPNVGLAGLQSLNNLILANGTGLASNYTALNPVLGSATIAPAPLIITAANDSKVFGSATTTNNVTYDLLGQAVGTTGYLVSGLIAGTGDAISAVTLNSMGGQVSAGVSNGNTYAITPSAATGNGLANYNITYIDGALTVTEAQTPVIAPVIVTPLINAGALREVLDLHADQTQLTVDSRRLPRGAMIVSVDEVARANSSVMKSTEPADKSLLVESYDGALICSVDQYGDSFCGGN